MISLGNNQYQITNSGTGETQIVPGEQLSQFGLDQANALNGNPTAATQSSTANETQAMPGSVSSPSSMQINNGQDALIAQSQQNPNAGQMPASPLAPANQVEQFGNPTPPSSPGNNGGIGADMLGLASGILPALGPEGMLAKVVLGAAGGLATGLATGGNTNQVLFDTLGGAAGMAAITELTRLIPASFKMGIAGKMISSSLDNADAKLAASGNAPDILTNALQNKFGDAGAINESILPAATGSEKTNLAATLGHEITTLGQGGLGTLTLNDLHNFKMGYDAKAAWTDPSPTASEKLYRNMSGGMNQIISQYAGPTYQKGNALYKDAKNDEFMNATFGQKLMQRLRTGMYAYYDTQALMDVARRMSGNTNNTQPSSPTLPLLYGNNGS